MKYIKLVLNVMSNLCVLIRAVSTCPLHPVERIRICFYCNSPLTFTIHCIKLLYKCCI